MYAHAPNRKWEADGAMPADKRKMCKDIARQLIEDEPGKNINVCIRMLFKKQFLFVPKTFICYKNPENLYSCHFIVVPKNKKMVKTAKLLITRLVPLVPRAMTKYSYWLKIYFI